MPNNKKQQARVNLYKNTSDNEKAPMYRGFISIPAEVLAYLNDAEVDSYGCVKLDISLWRDIEKNCLSGTAAEPYKKPNSAAPSKEAPKKTLTQRVRAGEVEESEDF